MTYTTVFYSAKKKYINKNNDNFHPALFNELLMNITGNGKS